MIPGMTLARNEINGTTGNSAYPMRDSDVQNDLS
jgi:hypothetical protein